MQQGGGEVLSNRSAPFKHKHGFSGKPTRWKKHIVEDNGFHTQNHQNLHSTPSDFSIHYPAFAGILNQVRKNHRGRHRFHQILAGADGADGADDASKLLL